MLPRKCNALSAFSEIINPWWLLYACVCCCASFVAVVVLRLSLLLLYCADADVEAVGYSL